MSGDRHPRRPRLPLGRLRGSDRFTELRAADLRFDAREAESFLAGAMGVQVGQDAIAALTDRTEGWVAGLQLAALALRSTTDVDAFVAAFNGSDRFVLDYLLEEVLGRQDAATQTFLLRTSILGRFCGPLCEAIVPDADGQATLEALDAANVFVVPLDHERRWYRYHRLFADLLRQRLGASTIDDPDGDPAALHARASDWFADHRQGVDAFRHAVAADDHGRLGRLLGSDLLPVHSRDAVMAIVGWLRSITAPDLAARPDLGVLKATMSLVAGITEGVEDALNDAELSLANLTAAASAPLRGRIAAARATLAVTRYQPDIVMAESAQAHAFLAPDDEFQLTARWTMGIAHALRSERAEALTVFTDLERDSRDPSRAFIHRLALGGLAESLEWATRLPEAAAVYHRALASYADEPQPSSGDCHLGLARIYYEWNDLDAAREHAERGLRLSRMFDASVDRFVVCEVELARIDLARGSAAAAASALDRIAHDAVARGFERRLPDCHAVHVRALVRMGEWERARELAEASNLDDELARVLRVSRNHEAAVTLLQTLRERYSAAGWHDRLLAAQVQLALALDAAHRATDAVATLRPAIATAAAGEHIRVFLDEGTPMRDLLSRSVTAGPASDFVRRVLEAFDAEPDADPRPDAASGPLPAGLTAREVEVLRLIAQGLSNQQIGDQLFLALDTVKGCNRRLFEKLGVSRRTEAVARGRALGVLPPG